jgi:transcriptional regulator with XRE-family HTH domain
MLPYCIAFPLNCQDLFRVSAKYFLVIAMVDRIKALCKQKKISIRQLEIAVGVGNGNIARWDTQRPRVDQVYNVAQYFGVSMEFLLTGEEKQATQKDGLSPDVRAFIDYLRQMPEQTRSAVLPVLLAGLQAAAAQAAPPKSE